MNFQINILKPEEEEETCTSPVTAQDIPEQIKINDEATSSNLQIKINVINSENTKNTEDEKTNEIVQNKEQLDATLLVPAYDPFQVPQQARGRSPMKRKSKLISQSFVGDDQENQKGQYEEEQQYNMQLPELPEIPRQRSCLKDRGKFRRSTKKKMSRSFFGRPLKPFFAEEQNQLLVENANLSSQKSSFKVNFDKQIRVERVESYKVYNVLEDELKKKIVNNSRSQFAQQQSKPARSKQPSIADAFSGGTTSDDKICLCIIF